MPTRSTKRILSLFAAAILALIFGAQALAESITVYTASDNAAVYDASGHLLGALPADTELLLTGMNGDICRVERGGKTAYMLKSQLSATRAGGSAGGADSGTPEGGVSAYVSRDGAAVYSADGKAMGALALNTKLTVTGVKRGICRVTADGHTGYMKKADLSATPVDASAGEPAAAASRSVTAYVSREGAAVYSAGGRDEGALALNTPVTVTAVKGEFCRVTAGGRTVYMRKADLSAEKAQAAPQPAARVPEGSAMAPARGTAKEMDWWESDIQAIFARGVVAQITDVETGLSWREKRFGGTNHADCQPLTAADTAALKRAYGGTWSWNRRAVFVTINGVNYAASINGMPHGGGSIDDNEFNGHHCIHFTNSRTHGSNKVDSQHQAAIKKAAAATLR